MTLNASGPISLGGSTTGQSIAIELLRFPTSQIDLNDSTVRKLSGSTTANSPNIVPAQFWGKTWTPGQYWTYTFGSNRNMYALATSGSLYVMGGVQAVAYSSPEGTNWTSISVALGSNTVQAAAYGNGYFFMAASTGSAGVGSNSTDGATWVQRASFATVFPTFSPPTCVIYGDQFVAAGAKGSCGTSPTGTTWTSQSGLSAVWGTSNGVTAICWNGSLYMAVGVNGACATSPDAITWTYRSGLNAVIGSDTATAVVGANSNFYVGTLAGVLAVSADNGATWSTVPAFTTAFTAVQVYTILWTGKNYCALGGQFNTTFGKCATSPDGVTWTSQTTAYQAAVASPGYGNTFYNGRIVSVGFNARVKVSG
jgi:hypothetical protein